MGYYSRHAIFLMDNDIQKLKTIQKLLEDKDIYFVIRKQTVYLENGEPLRIPCISDVNWNSGMGYKWYDFDYDMQAVSELFNEQFPDVQILVYEKTEDEFEILHTFLAGERLHYDDVIHYQKELEKVCKSLNSLPDSLLQSCKHSQPSYNCIPWRCLHLYRLYCLRTV